MGLIKKIKDRELIGGVTELDIYPVTSTKAVYNANNENLDTILLSLLYKNEEANNADIEQIIDHL